MSDYSNPTASAGQPKTFTHLLPLEAPTPARAFAAECRTAGLDVRTNRWANASYPYWFVSAGDGEQTFTATVYDDGITSVAIDEVYADLAVVRHILGQRIAARQVDSRPRWLETLSDGSVVDINGEAVSA